MTDAPKPGAEPLSEEELTLLREDYNEYVNVFSDGGWEYETVFRLLATITALKEQVAELKGRGDNVEPDTGHPEADRLIARLMSSDPDFDDCVDASVLIRQLVVEHKGPDGFATWKDAALAERLEKVALQKEVAELRAERDEWMLAALDKQSRKS